MSSWLEGAATSFLTKYLGKYIDGLNNINLSLGQGDIKLENLTLRKDALDDLELPVVVKAGDYFSVFQVVSQNKSIPTVIFN